MTGGAGVPAGKIVGENLLRQHRRACDTRRRRPPSVASRYSSVGIAPDLREASTFASICRWERRDASMIAADFPDQPSPPLP